MNEGQRLLGGIQVSVWGGWFRVKRQHQVQGPVEDLILSAGVDARHFPPEGGKPVAAILLSTKGKGFGFQATATVFDPLRGILQTAGDSCSDDEC